MLHGNSNKLKATFQVCQGGAHCDEGTIASTIHCIKDCEEVKDVRDRTRSAAQGSHGECGVRQGLSGEYHSHLLQLFQWEI